jgi:hypothetical protein
MKNSIRIPSGLPKSISLGSKLLYLSLLLGLINSFLLEFTTTFKNLSDPRALTISIFTLGLMLFFAYKIQMGKNWARITFIVLFTLGLLFYPKTLIQFLYLNPISFTISIMQTGLQIFALILLFKPDSKNWYNKIQTG